MIAKELDPFTASADAPIARAGRAAEEQMTFYLRRERRQLGYFEANGNPVTLVWQAELSSRRRDRRRLEPETTVARYLPGYGAVGGCGT